MAIPTGVLAGLLAGPLESFVERRSALAAQAKEAGNAGLAAELAAVRKPSLSIWVVDRLARDHRDAIGAALDAGLALRQLHRRILAGDPSAARQLRAARERLASCVESCGTAAAAALEASGRAGSVTTIRRAETTIHAAAVGTRRMRDGMRAAVLTADLDPPGFGVVEDEEEEEAATARPPLSVVRPVDAPRARSRRDAPERAAARARLAAALDARDAADRGAAEAERAAARLEAAAGAAAEHRDQLRAALTAAEQEALAAAQAATRAAADARNARRTAQQAAMKAEGLTRDATHEGEP